MKASKQLKIAPFFLIGLGVIFLLNNLGILPWGIWINLWKFWPLLLILIGIEIVLGQSISLRTTIILAILIFLIPILLSVNPFSKNPLATESLKINQPLGTLAKAKILIDLPATNLKISALNSPSLSLVRGTIQYSKIADKPSVALDSAFGQGILKITQPFISNNIPFVSSLRNQTDLSLTEQIPLELQIKTGASQENLDLHLLKIDSLVIDSQASTIIIILGNQYSCTVRIKTSAATVELKLPPSMEAKVKVNSKAKSVNVPSRFKKSGDEYKTQGFDSAPIRADVSIETLAGSVNIK